MNICNGKTASVTPFRRRIAKRLLSEYICNFRPSRSFHFYEGFQQHCAKFSSFLTFSPAFIFVLSYFAYYFTTQYLKINSKIKIVTSYIAKFQFFLFHVILPKYCCFPPHLRHNRKTCNTNFPALY